MKWHEAPTFYNNLKNISRPENFFKLCRFVFLFTLFLDLFLILPSSPFHYEIDLIKLILEAFHQTPNNNHHLINGHSAVVTHQHYQEYPPEHLIWYRKLYFLQTATQCQIITVAVITAEVKSTRSFMTINFIIPQLMIEMIAEINLLVNESEYHVV